MNRKATAVHCVAAVLWERPCIAIKTAKVTAIAAALQKRIGLLPKRSIVDGKNQVPMAKEVFMQAAISWVLNDERPPICVKIVTVK